MLHQPSPGTVLLYVVLARYVLDTEACLYFLLHFYIVLKINILNSKDISCNHSLSYSEYNHNTCLSVVTSSQSSDVCKHVTQSYN